MSENREAEKDRNRASEMGSVLRTAMSPTNEDHRPVLHLRYIEHP